MEEKNMEISETFELNALLKYGADWELEKEKLVSKRAIIISL